MKKIFAFLILILCMLSLYAGIAASTIFYADKADLEKMCILRGLEIGSEDEMRIALYAYENIDVYNVSEKSKESEYTIEILSADSLNKNGDFIVLSGDASLSFKEEGSSEKVLYAGTIIVDANNKKLTAMDEVVFEDKDKDASLNSISADIVTVFWESGKIFVTDATTSSERENSEEEKVMFYTAGESLTYFPDGGILYEDGFIASNPKTRYSSIKAETIAMLPGEDMFISNAWLNIGRVPILYVPFFFFPGSRVIGNPSFGFDSAKGAFLNTTFEIFGVDENIKSSGDKSSFTAILKSGDSSSELYPNGYYYDSDGKTSSVADWAEKTGSYLSISADSYSGGAVLSGGALHLGMNGQMTLLDDALNLTLSNGVALSSPVYPYTSNFRYYGDNSLSYSNNGLKLNAAFPFYSDDKVVGDFKNRLYGFSIDPILGQEPEFPSEFKNISSFTRSLSLSYSLPKSLTNKYISSLNLTNLSLKGVYEFDTSSTKKIDGKYTTNPDQYTYVIESSELPGLALNVSGTIFSFSKSVNNSEDDSSKDISYSDIHLLSDSLLAPLYTEEIEKAKVSASSYNASLKYSISNKYTNSNEYLNSIVDENLKSYSLSSKITLSASISKWFSLSDILTPSYSFKDQSDYSSSGVKIKEIDQINLSNDLAIKIPELGLSYNLSMRIINSKITKSYSSKDGVIVSSPSYSEDIEGFNWDKNSITQHKIGFSKSFETDYGVFTPTISYTLKPLTGSFNPKISFKYGSLALALQWKFLEDKANESYKKDMLEFSIGYTSTYFTLSNSLKYQTKDFDSSDFFKPLSITNSLSVRSSDKKYSLTQALKYSSYSKSYNMYNYVDSLKYTLSVPYFQSSLNWRTDGVSGKLEFSDFNMKLSYSSNPFQYWKGRVYLKAGVESEFTMDESGFETASFTISPSLTFSVAEFIAFKFSFISYNNSFYNYYIDDEFSLSMMFDDLLRSFDFIGDGRRNTYFVMRSASLEAVHYMEDWDLHCKYSAEVVKSGTEYSLLPKFSIYLSWKTLPELKVDEKWEQKRVDNSLEWVKSN